MRTMKVKPKAANLAIIHALPKIKNFSLLAIDEPGGKPNRDMNMTAQQITFNKTIMET